MSSLQDPYYDSRDKLQNAVDKISTTFEGVKTLYESGRYTPDIVSTFQSLEFDLRNVKKEAKSLRKVVIAVEDRREAFSHITEAELSTRKKFVNSVGGRIKNLEKYIETALVHLGSSTISSPAAATPSATPTSTVNASSLKPKPAARKGGQARAALTTQKNQPQGNARQVLKARQAKHSAYDQEADEVLGDMSAILDRLAGSSSTINEALVRQSDLIKDTNDEMTSTESLMGLNLSKMDVILKKSKSGRICTLIILILVAIGLFFMILYLP